MAELADRAAMQGRLTEWLAKRMPEATDLAISGLAPPADGEANETFLFTATWDEPGGARHEELVVRLSPQGPPFFLGSNLRFQWDVMATIAANSSVPVPKLWWYEADESVLGAPFYVMGRAEGKCPNQYRSELFQELNPEQRTTMYRNGIEALVEIHAIDHTKFTCLADRRRGAPGLESYLAYVEEWFPWAAEGRSFPVIEAAVRWLRERVAPTHAPAFIWGDSRPGNLMVRPADQSVAAVLDWEVAAVAAPEADLGWWLMFEKMYGDMGDSVPDGVPDRAATLAMYENTSGRALVDMAYFDVFAWCRFAITFIKYADVTRGTDREAQATQFGAYVTDQLAEGIGVAG